MKFFALVALAFWLTVSNFYLSVCARAQDKGFKEGRLVAAAYHNCEYGNCSPFSAYQMAICVSVRSQTLIGIQVGQVLSHGPEDPSSFKGQPIEVNLDGEAINVVLPNGHKKHYSIVESPEVDKLFIDSPSCIAGTHAHWLSRVSLQRPTGVPLNAILIPASSNSYYWMQCRLVIENNWDACAVWEVSGKRLFKKDRELVSRADHRAVSEGDLQIDPLLSTPYKIRLRNGVELVDWAKCRTNDIPCLESVAPLPPR